jgi:capsular exopolysaccharide synthesis family protein
LFTMRNRRLLNGPSTPDQWVVQRDEVFRLLRSNLLVALEELERPTVIVTSAMPDEGKTTICSHLAVSLAQAGLRVVAIDVDFRHANLHTLFGASNEAGLSDVLQEGLVAEEVLQYCVVGPGEMGLYVLPTGRGVPNPTELLGSGRMARLLESMAFQADVVLLDTPPVLPVADALVLGRMAAGAILVVESRRTPITALQKAKDALTRNQTRLLGIVLNKVQPRDLGQSTYGYGAFTADGDGDTAS